MTAPVVLDLLLVDRPKNGALHVAREGCDPADGSFLWPSKGDVESFDISGTRVRVVMDRGLASARGLLL